MLRFAPRSTVCFTVCFPIHLTLCFALRSTVCFPVPIELAGALVAGGLAHRSTPRLELSLVGLHCISLLARQEDA
jgi:hypothetical protein